MSDQSVQPDQPVQPVQPAMSDQPVQPVATVTEGSALGNAEGNALGNAEGAALGNAQGSAEGSALGSAQGNALGSAQGNAEGGSDCDGDDKCDCCENSACSGKCGCGSSTEAVEDSPEELRRKAEKMLADMPAEHREGLRDLFELARCIGMPGARALLMSAAPYGAVLPAAEVAARIEAATPFECEGSIQVDFVDQRTGEKAVANIYAAPAPRTYDFGRASAALRAAVPADRWTHVAKNFSNLVLYVRTQVMSAAAGESSSTSLAECGGAVAEIVRASLAGRLVVQIDPINLTMFIHPDWARVGVYVGGATPGTMFE